MNKAKAETSKAKLDRYKTGGGPAEVSVSETTALIQQSMPQTFSSLDVLDNDNSKSIELDILNIKMC